MRHLPTILAGVGTTSLITTAYLAYKYRNKADEFERLYVIEASAKTLLAETLSKKLVKQSKNGNS